MLIINYWSTQVAVMQDLLQQRVSWYVVELHPSPHHCHVQRMRRAYASSRVSIAVRGLVPEGGGASLHNVYITRKVRPRAMVSSSATMAELNHRWATPSCHVRVHIFYLSIVCSMCLLAGIHLIYGKFIWIKNFV